jgi:hypothetical protein
MINNDMKCSKIVNGNQVLEKENFIFAKPKGGGSNPQKELNINKIRACSSRRGEGGRLERLGGIHTSASDAEAELEDGAAEVAAKAGLVGAVDGDDAFLPRGGSQLHHHGVVRPTRRRMRHRHHRGREIPPDPCPLCSSPLENEPPRLDFDG